MPFMFTEFFTNLVPIALVISVIHILFVSLMYMVSKLLSNENLLGFARHEFSQAIYSLIIVGSTIGGIVLVNNLFCTALSDANLYTDECSQDIGLTAHLKVAREHLAESYNNIRVLAKGVLRAYDWAATAGSASTSAGLFKIAPFKYSVIHAFVYGELFSILYKVLLFVKFQELFLIINAIYFFPAFFNLGLVFRILPFTRKLGGLLMGITLGLFFALPYMYILSQVVIESAENFSYKFMLESSKHAFAFLTFGSIVDGDHKRDFEEYIEETRKQADTNVFGKAVAEQLMKRNVNYDYNIGISSNIPNAADNAAFGGGKQYSPQFYDPNSPENRSYSLTEVAARIILAVTFSSIFSLVGTLSAIREISSLFGGDVEIAGLTRLI
ncbi:MAG: hypothetical protein ACP5H8_00840 [Candidatus Micrarchaeia archaeon]